MPESPLERLRRLEAEEKRGKASGWRAAKAGPDGQALKRGGIGAVAVAALLFAVSSGC